MEFARERCTDVRVLGFPV